MSLHPIAALNEVLEEYRDYLRTEFRAKDRALREALEAELDQPGFLAQEPFYQAHRPFKPGLRWEDLPLDVRFARALASRARNERSHLHQSEAIRYLLGPDAGPLVVTTGTGSGKTEAFQAPAIQNAFQDAGTFQRGGLTALFVYPMNALANDQEDRIKEYLRASGWEGAVTVARYDRGTTQEERERLRARPPHILLTNYMMLEYLLTRPADRDGIFANHRCRFVVLDEVHTYRGALGSNIALLIRRLKAHLARARQDFDTEPAPDRRERRYPGLLLVGTSATIKSVDEAGRTPEEVRQLRDEAVQDFFGKLTGFAPASIRVIGEELEEQTIPADAVYAAGPPPPVPARVTDAEAIRQTLCALSDSPAGATAGEAARRTRLLWELNAWLVRRPMSVSQIVDRVREEVPGRAAREVAEVRQEVEAALVAGAARPDDTPGALRLRAHRFFRGGWRFHRCVNPDCGRLYAKGEDRCERCGFVTAPLYLCRSCGADYLRLVGPEDPASEPLRASADEAEGMEWMVYDPSRFETQAGDEEPEEGMEPAPQGRGGRRQNKMRGRPVVTGSLDPRNLAFSGNASDYP